MVTKRSFPTLFVLICILALPFAVQAQTDLSETFTAKDGSFSFQYPQHWTASEQADGSIVLTKATLTIAVYGGSAVADVVSARDAVETLAGFLRSKSILTDDPEAFSIGARDGARAAGSQGTQGTLAFSVPLTGGGYGIIVASGPSDALSKIESTVLAMAESLDSSASSTPSSGRDCTVQTDKARSAVVRVGPGSNRSTVVFLPSGQPFKVIGKAAASDGSLWWKLDKAEVAPKKAAAEAWVAQDDVTTDGDCSQVSDAAAPPVIPIPKAQPTPVPGSTPAAELLPTSGTWTLQVGKLSMTCPGTGTFSIELENSTGTIEIDAASDGSTLSFGGDQLQRTQPGVYGGSYDLSTPEQNLTAQLTLRVVSADRLEGEMTFSGTFGSQTCTGSTPLTVTH